MSLGDLNQSLLEYQVSDNALLDNNNEVNFFTKNKRQQSLFYLAGLVLAEITWVMICFTDIPVRFS